MVNVLLTVDQVAERLQLGRTKVYELLRSGDIESVVIGSARRIPSAAVDAFIHRLAGRTNGGGRSQ